MQLHRNLTNAIAAVEALNNSLQSPDDKKLSAFGLLDKIVFEGRWYTSLLREAIRQLKEKENDKR